MRIEQPRVFTEGMIAEIKSILAPSDARDTVTQDFIKNYHHKKYIRVDIPITLALCILDKNESWSTAVPSLKNDGWSGASLSEWHLYVYNKKGPDLGAVTLPGVRYIDDNLVAWVPVVKYHSRTFFKSATEISMKLSETLTIAKPRIVLIKKIEVLKP